MSHRIVPSRSFQLAAFAVGLASATGLAACGGDSAPTWMVFTSPTAGYTVDLPGDPEYQEVVVPTGLMQLWQIELGGDGFAVSDLALGAGAESNLDGAVDGALEAMRKNLESQSGESVAYSIVDTSANPVGTFDARRVVAEVRVDGETTMVLYLRVFASPNGLHQVFVLDAGDDDQVDSARVVDSVVV